MRSNTAMNKIKGTCFPTMSGLNSYCRGVRSILFSGSIAYEGCQVLQRVVCDRNRDSFCHSTLDLSLT